MKNWGIKKLTAYSLQLTAIFILAVSITSCARKEPSAPLPTSKESASEKIDYYTCGMHPSVRVSPEEYNKGKTNCPICNMKLTPVYKEKAGEEVVYYGCGMEGEEHVFVMKDEQIENCPICKSHLKKLSNEEADRLRGVVSRVSIKNEQAALAGVSTAWVRRLHLYKEIRTVGKVAYDPKLAVAQEEFISALVARDKIRKGEISEIVERAEKLVESSRRKLLLLGMSLKQTENMEVLRKIQESLILPQEKMWVYGDIYEYEIGWVEVGGKVVVTTISYPGEEFIGEIISVNPVFDPNTRSVRFRAEVNNPSLKLKPEMYVDVIIKSMYVNPDGEHFVLAIPKSAVLDTGVRKIVWVEKGNGQYEGREVVIGPEATATINDKEAKFFPVIKGLAEGEPVVARANFLIDSQSQLTGLAAAAYGGALGTKEKEKKPPAHVH